MKTACVAVGLIVSGIASVGSGQTNLAVPPLHLFSIPSAYSILEQHETAPVKSSTELSASLSTSADPNSITASIEKYQKWYGDSWLQPQRKNIGEGGFYHWAKDKIFPEPETVRFKHISLSGGVVTAIKKRNPLALINPTVFSITY